MTLTVNPPNPDRPENVPAEAEFRADLGDVWIHGGVDDRGERSGPWSVWTAAGVLVEETEYRAGTKNGMCVQFYPSGQPRAEGEYLEDEKAGPWRFWSEQGRLVREAEYENDRLTGDLRCFDENGTVVLEALYEDGCKHGPFSGRVPPGYYADPRVRVERGTFEKDHAVGEWSLLDQNQTVLATTRLGLAVHDDEQLLQSHALANEARSAAEWTELASRLVSERRITEGLLAAARAAGSSGSASGLRNMLAEHALHLSESGARTAAAHVLSVASGRLAPLPNALIRGAAPAPLLRGIAIFLDRHVASRAGLDLVNAALAYAPTAREYYFTRALIHMSLGNDHAAREDAMLLKPKEPENAQFLLDYARVLFTRFDFWPGHSRPDTYYDGLPDAPAQSLEAVQTVARKYATRLMTVRQRLIEQVGPDVSWMLPDLSHMLPAGPVALTQFSFAGTDEDGGAYEVEVDETLDVSDWEIPALLRIARSDWNALAWLCWSAGLDRVAVPETLRPPLELGRAAGMSAQRLWRCRDKVHMGGWGARNQEIPGFDWEGMDIDAMSPHLARIAEAEYAEMQAMFYWLCGGDNQSPWQDNLRGS